MAKYNKAFVKRSSEKKHDKKEYDGSAFIEESHDSQVESSSPKVSRLIERQTWKIMLVGNYEDIIKDPTGILRNNPFQERGLQFITASTIEEAKEQLRIYKDIAVIVIDLVLEKGSSGLELVEYIRDELQNNDTRVVLQSQQVDVSEPEKIMSRYEINDFMINKTQLTSQDLFITILSSLRSFSDINSIEKSKNELEIFIDSLIRYSAAIIDDRSKQTAGHSRRVAEYAYLLALEINECKNIESLSKINFDESQLKELWLAAWLHDIGKIGIPEVILDKDKKLTAISDRLEEIEYRILLKKSLDVIEVLKAELPKDKLNQILGTLEQDQDIYDEALLFLRQANTGEEYMSDEKLKKLNKLAQWRYYDGQNHRSKPILTEEELEKLSVRKGNLTKAEREQIKNHANITQKILDGMIFPGQYKNIQKFAYLHHEKLNGEGYPLGLIEGQIPIQAQILALVDIYDALISTDRKYKKPYSSQEAIEILRKEVEKGALNKDLFKLFIDTQIYNKVEARGERRFPSMEKIAS